MEKLQHAIVVTGGIGSGKSTICNLLKLYGYSVIDADAISHFVLDSLKDEVVKFFGEKILNNNKIDRKILGNIIFNDVKKREILENLLHPKIREEIYKEARKLELTKKPYFIDIPLFFESKHFYNIPNVLLVYTTKEMQIQRLISRNNLSRDDALLRIESQIDIDIKKSMSNYILENTKDLAHLQRQIEAFLKILDS